MAATDLTAAGLAPGVYDDLPPEAYHADPALSSTGARRLLPPGCPARFRWEQDNVRLPSRAMERGTAAHLAVLGVGSDVVIVDAPDWRTKKAREKRDAARAEGAVPLLAHEYEQVQAMADAIRQHPVAGRLFAPGAGRAEVSLFWEDRPTGIRRRARLDWLRAPVAGRRLVVPDYKTAADASPEAIRKAVATYGYHQQAAWYLDGVNALGLAPDGAAWVLVVQEVAPPYLVTVVELTPYTLQLGAAKNRAAIEVYRECVASGRWPGYADDIEYIALPPWAESRDEEYL